MSIHNADLIHIEVAYATPERQRILKLEVPFGTTVFEGAHQSGITAAFPEIDLEAANMGIFGKAVKKPKTEVLKEGDRIEIYRPLKNDPKANRSKRAKQSDG